MLTKLDVSYDHDNDILYISFGSPRPSYCVTEVDDIFIMKDVETDEYSGVTIMDFQERLEDGSILNFEWPFDLDLAAIKEAFNPKKPVTFTR
ncbi:hypothetical protein HX99_02345 [Peptococcaceae bacterium SCADC1_2_3]|jgi:uncharacterized protein YuzE|nr:hypothetical protein DK28_0210640 [Peptococcaceae bacterium SCADC1_2_3]KFI36096.1 hypothetical protein HY02_01845 [Peptococcaceae bacterium SCADC1_2_3]KFI36686.1 hypothetical protein HX99_02345 [Peptococcaceae bacterium SCADC1_2_3]HBQ28035.1 DUF2283 domain-containing protein [Desulfotomaculum sp.]HCJ79793.1 DUF2283 domain-containing protein [Desulfotomaculum sp.]